MDLPIALAIALAFGRERLWFTVTGGGAVYYDSVAMFTFFVLLGRYLEMRARHRAGLAGGTVLSLVPAAATRVAGRRRASRTDTGRAACARDDLVLVSARARRSLPTAPMRQRREQRRRVESSAAKHCRLRRPPGDRVSAGTLNTDGALTAAGARPPDSVHASARCSRWSIVRSSEKPRERTTRRSFLALVRARA
jgi:Cu2+-exporting ATPase